MIEPALKVINELEKEGLIEKYAVGGAFAVLFYIEPIVTYDLDIFVVIPQTSGRLVSLSPIYDRLRQRGYRMDREHVIIEGVPVQFLSPYNALVEEALDEAVEIKVGGAKTWVFRAEHLAALMLQTGRRKDRERLALFSEEAKINRRRLNAILARHGLQKKWKDFLQ